MNLLTGASLLALAKSIYYSAIGSYMHALTWKNDIAHGGLKWILQAKNWLWYNTKQ